ncbi:MAG TPA: phosphohydrolase, partial [Candidatus Kaiserbacteria bacterium]|nr:phosphohydrolase [Candidatus Kaiserbacteria bacterium]
MNIHSILDFTRFLNSFRAIKRVIFTIGDGGPENDSEHSYQLAMMAWY